MSTQVKRKNNGEDDDLLWVAFKRVKRSDGREEFDIHRFAANPVAGGAIHRSEEDGSRSDVMQNKGHVQPKDLLLPDYEDEVSRGHLNCDDQNPQNDASSMPNSNDSVDVGGDDQNDVTADDFPEQSRYMEGDDDFRSGHVCSECFLGIAEEDQVCLFLCCGHFFHEKCMLGSKMGICPSCWWIAGKGYNKAEVMSLTIAKMVLLWPARERFILLRGISMKRQQVQMASPRDFFNIVREDVFAGSFPTLRNLYFLPRKSSHKEYTCDGNEIDIFLRQSNCQCWQDSLVYTIRNVSRSMQYSEVVMYQLELFIDMFC